jgi:hypothetical protein
MINQSTNDQVNDQSIKFMINQSTFFKEGSAYRK